MHITFDTNIFLIILSFKYRLRIRFDGVLDTRKYGTLRNCERIHKILLFRDIIDLYNKDWSTMYYKITIVTTRISELQECYHYLSNVLVFGKIAVLSEILYGSGSSSGKKLGYGLHGPGSIPGVGGAEFSSLLRVQTGPGVHSTSYKMSTGAFLGVKTAERRTSHAICFSRDLHHGCQPVRS